MKYYYYQSSSLNAHQLLKNFFEENYEGELSQTMINDTIGVFLAEDDFFDVVDNILSLIIHDFGISLTFLASHEESETALYFLQKACSLCNEKCSYLSDVLFTCILAGIDTTPYLKQQFAHIAHEEMQCAFMYVSCGMSVMRAAKKLFIHRNTFTYRLQKFINASNLDIREFHNALYFYYASQLL